VPDVPAKRPLPSAEPTQLDIPSPQARPDRAGVDEIAFSSAVVLQSQARIRTPISAVFADADLTFALKQFAAG